jgi:hypothetical protein
VTRGSRRGIGRLVQAGRDAGLEERYNHPPFHERSPFRGRET